MALLGHDRYCDELLTQTDGLRATVHGADPAAVVPTCPGWSVADLVRHIGGNLLTVGTAVRTGLPVEDPRREVAGLPGPGADDPAALDSWLGGAAEDFSRTLRATGPGGMAEVWGLRQSTGAWARRATHDVVVHRADAAAAVGARYAVAPEVAVDAIDELLELVPAIGLSGRLAGPLGRSAADAPDAGSAEGTGRDPGPDSAARPGTGAMIHLHATDTEEDLGAGWLIDLRDGGFAWSHGHGDAAVHLRGPLADVLRVFYRRLPPDTPRVEVRGDAALLDFWLERISLD